MTLIPQTDIPQTDATLRGELFGINPGQLFANHNLSQCQDTRRAVSSVSNVFFEHSLRTTARTLEALNFVHRGAFLGSTSFNYISYGAEVEVTVNQVGREKYIMVLPLTGTGRVTNRGSVADVTPGSLIVLEPLSPFKFQLEANHSHLAVGISRERLHNFYSRVADSALTPQSDFQLQPYHHRDLDPGLLDFIGYLCRELDRPNATAHSSFVAHSIEEAFLSLMCSSLCTQQSFSGEIDEAGLNLDYLQKAEQFIAANLTEDIAAEDIVAASGATSRTLYRAYSQQFSMSPVARLHLCRLYQARNDLLSRRHGTSITDLAMLYQYSNVGRFAKAYCNEFGELPSDTLKKSHT